MKNNKKIAIALIAALSIFPKCNSHASVENLSQNIIKEPKEDVDINSLSKDQIPKNAWIHVKEDGKDIFVYFDGEGNEQKRQDYNPNDPIANRLNDSNSGNIKITYNESKDYASLNINIRDIHSKNVYIIRVNKKDQIERLPKGKYKIDSIGAVDKDGYYKETVNNYDNREFEIKSQDELKAENKNENDPLELKINEVVDMADIVNEDLIDPELEARQKKDDNSKNDSKVNSDEILNKLDKEYSDKDKKQKLELDRNRSSDEGQKDSKKNKQSDDNDQESKHARRKIVYSSTIISVMAIAFFGVYKYFKNKNNIVD